MENQNSAESISNHIKIFEILILNGQIQSKKIIITLEKPREFFNLPIKLSTYDRARGYTTKMICLSFVLEFEKIYGFLKSKTKTVPSDAEAPTLSPREFQQTSKIPPVPL